MYFPYVHRRKPSNSECRVASILSVVGFVAFGWLLLAIPRSGGVFLAAMVAVLVLFYVALGTLLQARPSQGLLWPTLATRSLPGRLAPPLDERELHLRYRTFLISYQILTAAIVACVVLGVPAAVFLSEAVGGRDARVQVAMMKLLALLFLLAFLLPNWVLPWLESGVGMSEEPVLTNAGAGRWNWRSILLNLIVWVVLVSTLVWILAGHFPGGMRGLLRSM